MSLEPYQGDFGIDKIHMDEDTLKNKLEMYKKLKYCKSLPSPDIKTYPPKKKIHYTKSNSVWQKQTINQWDIMENTEIFCILQISEFI